MINVWLLMNKGSDYTVVRDACAWAWCVCVSVRRVQYLVAIIWLRAHANAPHTFEAKWNQQYDSFTRALPLLSFSVALPLLSFTVLSVCFYADPVHNQSRAPLLEIIRGCGTNFIAFFYNASVTGGPEVRTYIYTYIYIYIYIYIHTNASSESDRRHQD